MPTRVIVLGAVGKLGRRLVARGLARGRQVTTFVRSAARAGLADAARAIEGDAADEDAVAAAVRGHDAVVNACGIVTDGEPVVGLFATILRAVERERPATF